MDLAVYLNPSAGSNPGHMVVSGENPDSSRACFGYRFNPMDFARGVSPAKPMEKLSF